MLFKKTFAIFMALVMVLGCTSMVEAETVSENEAADNQIMVTSDFVVLAEAKSAVIEDLPEEMRDLNYLDMAVW